MLKMAIFMRQFPLFSVNTKACEIALAGLGLGRLSQKSGAGMRFIDVSNLILEVRTNYMALQFQGRR